ncbi:MAG TPA: SIS domain-containing protein [Bryobacteraceae bacterium]|nr:SIS domain-containing protein [Bryobacteraceae bacterium]
MEDENIRLVRRHLAESAAVKERLAEAAAPAIAQAAIRLAQAVSGGGKILLCGNGGSAADCQHIAAELTNRLRASTERPGIPAIALTTDTSYLTARANDCGFDGVYERLVATLGARGDALIAISTSGVSGNVIRAVQCARERSMLTIGLLGGTGGQLAGMVDVAIVVPSPSTQHIQEAHIAVGHILCEILEETLYGERVAGGAGRNRTDE